MKKNLAAVLFWGGLWGIWEATVAYLVHLLLPGLGWAFYYPAAYGFMFGVFRQTGKARSVLWAAALAALVKLVNLPMVPRIDYVINPAVSILLEGLTAFVAFPLLGTGKSAWGRNAAVVIVTSLTWRMLYLSYLSLAPGWIRDGSILNNTAKLAQFCSLETLGNMAVILLGSLAVSLLAGRWPRRAAGRLMEKALVPLSLAAAGLSIFLTWAL